MFQFRLCAVDYKNPRAHPRIFYDEQSVKVTIPIRKIKAFLSKPAAATKKNSQSHLPRRCDEWSPVYYPISPVPGQKFTEFYCENFRNISMLPHTKAGCHMHGQFNTTLFQANRTKLSRPLWQYAKLIDARNWKHRERGKKWKPWTLDPRWSHGVALCGRNIEKQNKSTTEREVEIDAVHSKLYNTFLHLFSTVCMIFEAWRSEMRRKKQQYASTLIKNQSIFKCATFLNSFGSHQFCSIRRQFIAILRISIKFSNSQ